MGQTDARYGWEAGQFGHAEGRQQMGRLPWLERLPYLTFLMAMMKKQPMMARAMATGKAKL